MTQDVQPDGVSRVSRLRVSRLHVHTWNKVTHKSVTAVDPCASATHMSHSVHMSAEAASVSCCQRAREISAREAPVFNVREREVWVLSFRNVLLLKRKLGPYCCQASLIQGDVFKLRSCVVTSRQQGETLQWWQTNCEGKLFASPKLDYVSKWELYLHVFIRVPEFFRITETCASMHHNFFSITYDWVVITLRKW